MSDLSAIFEQAFRLARDRFALFALTVIVLTGLGAASDLASERFLWPIFISINLLGVYFEAIVFASLLGLDPIPAVGRRFVSVIGWGVLVSVGFLVGLMLLVIPGLVLMLRWSIALPILLIEERGAYESLELSWRLTGAFWRLVIAAPAVVMLACLPYWLIAWLTSYPAVPVPMVFAIHFYVSLLFAFEWCICAVLYRHIRGRVPDVRIPEIFS